MGEGAGEGWATWGGDFSLALIPAWSWGQAAEWAGVCLRDVCPGVCCRLEEGSRRHMGEPRCAGRYRVVRLRRMQMCV